MRPEEFRKFGHQVVDWIADYRARIAERPVRSTSEPGSIRAKLPKEPPRQGEAFSSVLQDLDEIIAPGLTHWQHPSFFGYFPANAELSSVLGDYVSTGLGVIGLSWQSSPALTELEEVTTDWLRQMLGLSDTWSGVIQDTASVSTLVALLTARERASDYSMAHGGLQGLGHPLVVYASAQAHSSVPKAALMAGFGREHLRLIDTDAELAMDVDALARAIAEDVRAGRRPCAVVATTGTTATTALDPLKRIADIVRPYRVWLHVDAAMAGSAMILPERRWMWDGIERADSVVINAHKWLGSVFDCSLYYVRDVEALVRVMSTHPSYLRSAADEQVKNYRDWGLPLGRRFRALKLWFLLRDQGVEGLQSRLRRDLNNATWLETQARSSADWRVLAPVRLQTVCLRHEPPGLAGEALDQHTLRWVERVNGSGHAYLTPAILNGRWMVRVSIGSLSTEREHVQALWREVQEAAAASLAQDQTLTPT